MLMIMMAAVVTHTSTFRKAHWRAFRSPGAAQPFTPCPQPQTLLKGSWGLVARLVNKIAMLLIVILHIVILPVLVLITLLTVLSPMHLPESPNPETVEA